MNARLNIRRSRWLSLVLLPILALASVAQAQAILLSIPAGSADFVRLQPGESRTFTYTAENTTSNNLGPFTIQAGFGPGFGTMAGEYSFQPEAGSRCSITETPARFAFSSLAAQETVTCGTTVTRSLSSRNDLLLFYCPSLASCSLSYFFVFKPLIYVGELPDIALTSSIVPLPPGSTSAIVDITVSNPSGRAITRKFFATECAEFGGTGLVAPPFEIENDFPGACTTATSTAACNNGTGTASAKAYSSGPIPSHGEATCKLRLRFSSPLTSPQSLLMQSGNPNVEFTDGLGFDPNTANNETRFGAVPAEPAVFVPVPTLSRIALLLLVVLLAGLATTSVRVRWNR